MVPTCVWLFLFVIESGLPLREMLPVFSVYGTQAEFFEAIQTYIANPNTKNDGYQVLLDWLRMYKLKRRLVLQSFHFAESQTDDIDMKNRLKLTLIRVRRFLRYFFIICYHRNGLIIVSIITIVTLVEIDTQTITAVRDNSVEDVKYCRVNSSSLGTIVYKLRI